MAKKPTAARLSMACPFASVCDGHAIIKPCKGKRIRGAKYSDYWWGCECHASGYFSEDHFKLLDKAKKISIAIR